MQAVVVAVVVVIVIVVLPSHYDPTTLCSAVVPTGQGSKVRGRTKVHGVKHMSVSMSRLLSAAVLSPAAGVGWGGGPGMRCQRCLLVMCSKARCVGRTGGTCE